MNYDDDYILLIYLIQNLVKQNILDKIKLVLMYRRDTILQNIHNAYNLFNKYSFNNKIIFIIGNIRINDWKSINNDYKNINKFYYSYCYGGELYFNNTDIMNENIEIQNYIKNRSSVYPYLYQIIEFPAIYETIKLKKILTNNKNNNENINDFTQSILNSRNINELRNIIFTNEEYKYNDNGITKSLSKYCCYYKNCFKVNEEIEFYKTIDDDYILNCSLTDPVQYFRLQKDIKNYYKVNNLII
jgi:hypothetical protein